MSLNESSRKMEQLITKSVKKVNHLGVGSKSWRALIRVLKRQLHSTYKLRLIGIQIAIQPTKRSLVAVRFQWV